MDTRKRITPVMNIFHAKSNFTTVVRKPFKLAFRGHLFLYSILALGLALMLSFGWNSAGAAQDGVVHIGLVRVFEPSDTGLTKPAGLAFSSKTRAFHVVEARAEGLTAPADTDVVRLSPFEERVGSARIAAQVKDPINMVFDNKADRLLILQSPADKLIEVFLAPDGNLDPKSLIRRDVRSFGLQNPQGLSVDPASGHIFILDTVGPRIVRVEPEPDGSFTNAGISSVNLQPTGLMDVRGLAFDPTTGNLHLVSPAEQRLYELSQTGQVVASRDLSEFELGNPQGMVFAPSGDQTDDPTQMGLYLADGGRGRIDLLVNGGGAATQNPGQIVEFSFAAPIAPAAPSYISSLIQTTDMGAFSPPSPDPSGLAYLPTSSTLLMSDGEVEETVNGITHFAGANVWEITLGGSVERTANISKIALTVVPMTNEPTGVAWNPANGHFYVTDDGAKEVFELNPGSDGLIGTADDGWTRFDTLVVGSGDPEGIAFDSWQNRLFVADGVNREVYQFTLAGNLVGQFDVGVYGVVDPESVEFNSDSGTLFVLSSNRNSPVAIETTTSGALLQTIDVSVVNARAAAGLAYAPASDGSGTKRFYIVDRGIDNNNDPQIIDGKMYEMTAPPPSTPGNTPPVAVDDGYATDEDTALNVEAQGVLGNDSDMDGDPLAAVLDAGPVNGTLTLNGDGSFSYTPNANFNGTDMFSYHANDGLAGSNIATVTITVNPVNNDPPVARDDSASASKNTPLTINVAANDSDPDGNLAPASANTACATCAVPTNGSLVNNLNGTFGYTPNQDFTGSDSFVYEICDTDPLCDTASVSITVFPALAANFRLSLTSSGIVGSVDTRDEDILEFNGTSFAMFFDGSDVGVGGLDLDAFYVVDALTILMSFNNAAIIGSLGTVADSDIVRFDATSLGATTAGRFSMYFDGLDVGLDTSSEDIDAIELLADGRLLVSTLGNISVPGVSGKDEDLLAFTPTSLGENTSGSWAMYFDGSDVGLATTSDEDIDGVSIAANGDIYLTTLGNFAVTGVSGADEDVFICSPVSLGAITTCTFSPTLFFDGSLWGLDANDLDAIDLP
jgi:sugar lactone lactonase YvrE